MSEFWGRVVKDAKRGEIKDGDTRYGIFRADVIVETVNQMPEQSRGEVLRSFFPAVELHGRESLARYFDMVERDIDRLLETVAATAPNLGWGAWQFKRADNNLILEVVNSPYTAFQAPTGAVCCAPILGMFTALARMIFGEVAVAETPCASKAPGRCVFKAEKIT